MRTIMLACLPALLAAHPWCPAAEARADARPNVLLIVCDDLNTHVSPSGYDAIHTPALATLSDESMTFSRAFCQYPVCGPSRASFLSGLYPESTGVLDNKADIRQTRPHTVTLPQVFKANGYWTAGVGKVFHVRNPEQGDDTWDVYHRFDNDELPVVTAARKVFEKEHGPVEERQNRRPWKDAMNALKNPLNAQTPPGHGPSGLRDDQHKDGKNVRQVIQWLSQRSYGDQPFFITLGIQKPHVPFLAPDAYFDLYPPEGITFHRDRADLWDSLPQQAMSTRFKAFGFALGVEDESRRRSYMQAYHACVSFIDTQFGMVFEQLKKQGLWEETIIVFTSDHGYHLGDHFLWGKVTLFDIGAKVPFIVRVPGLTRAGSQSEAMVELIDIYPTLCELAGLEAPDHLQGTSLVPVLGDPEAAGSKSHAYSVVSRGKNLGYAIRDQHWRYGKWPDGEELYDLRRDPHERNNLARFPEYSEQLGKLRKLLDARQQEAGSNRSRP